ncbi:MAG: 3D domain-containing protein [Candidatus Moranbacteria bacterium]|nr:3D domain-containing protein [Candidatus Moranbacteria bacterium]
MGARKDFLFAIVLVSNVLSQIPAVEAAPLSSELPVSFEYDYQNDPFLLNWTFVLEDKNKQPAVPIADMSKEEKMLARWKVKQAHLWKALPTEPFIINASAYTAAADECGKSDGITASGIKVQEKRTLACAPNLPFGTKIAIEGMGEFRCEDRGGAIKGNHVDIYMQTKAEAFAFGRRNLTATVIK